MTAGERLYAQLPAAVRVRDAEVGEPLRALLALVGEQADALEADIARDYENLFIETCEDWVVPYLADLVGTVPLYDASRSQDDNTARMEFDDLRGPRLLPPVGASARADVARTIAMRRRKGTVSGIADVARYASGFPVHLIEGLARTAWIQHLRHSRPDLGTAHPATRLDSALVGTPFDTTSRFVDVRRPSGWYHPAQVTIAVYRQRAVAHRRVAARQADHPWAFRLDPLGLDRPLFTVGARVADLPPALAAAAVPSPLLPALFEADLLAHRSAPPPLPPHTVLYGKVGEQPDGQAESLGLWLGDSFVKADPADADDPAPAPPGLPARIVSRRLDPWPAAQPSGDVVAVDVRNGRVALGDGLKAAGTLRASFFHGASGLVGGGDYDRASWSVVTGTPTTGTPTTVAAHGADYPTLLAALTAWASGTDPHTVIRVLDSETYDLPVSVDVTGRSLVIEAANEEWPILRPEAPNGEVTVTGPGALTLSGVALDGRIATGQDVARLRLLHCTLPPGGRRDPTGALVADGPSVTVDGPSVRLRVQIAFSVLGKILLKTPADEVLLLDSVVAGSDTVDSITGDGAPDTGLRTERSTFLGQVNARTVEASECVFARRLVASRTQQGCLRYSYLPLHDAAGKASRAPRRFACQPELAIAKALAANGVMDPAGRGLIADAEEHRVRPVFVSREYGDPGFAALDPSCPVEIAAGAEDGSEMGVYGHIKQAQRLDNLRRRLAEYLPAGISAGVMVMM